MADETPKAEVSPAQETPTEANEAFEIRPIVSKNPSTTGKYPVKTIRLQNVKTKCYLDYLTDSYKGITNAYYDREDIVWLLWDYSEWGPGVYGISNKKCNRWLIWRGQGYGDDTLLVTNAGGPENNMNALWQFHDGPDWKIKLQVVDENRVLDAKGSSDKPRTPVLAYRDVGSENQRWYVHDV